MHRLSKLLVLLACLASLVARADTSASLEDALNQRLADIKTLSADFNQSTIDGSNRTLQKNSGHLWVASPSRFRIETSAPYEQTLVSDGNDFWSWDADLEQVIVKKLDTDIKQVPILLLGTDTSKITHQYNISYNRDEDSENYVLHARASGSLFETLTIEFSGQQPSAIMIGDSLGQQTRVELTHVVINQPIDDAKFHFVPPPNADIIDDRATQ